METLANLETTQCPCCPEGTPERVWANEGRGTQYRICRDCGTVYASPRASRDKRLAAFATGWGKEGAVRIAAMRRPALEGIAHYLMEYKQSGKLLDCGCSSGAFFENFERPKWTLHGVEVSPTAAAYAAENTGAAVHTGDLLSAQYPSDSFDLLTIIDSFYYFDNPIEQLHEAARVLHPEGILGIEIPGGAYSRARSRGLLCLLGSGKWYRLASDSHYLFIYSSKGFERLTAKIGLRLLAREIVPSPRKTGWSQHLSEFHFHSMRQVVRRFPSAIDWAPKVLWVFQKATAPANT